MSCSAIERHFFDKPDVHGMVSRKLSKEYNVVDVSALHYHAVDLDRYLMFEQEVQGFHHFSEIISARDVQEAFSVERIEAKVD